MTIVAVTTVRDEADIIERTLRHLTGEGVDHLIVCDCASVDDTPAVLDRLAGELPLTVIHDPDPAHWQAERVTYMAAMAARMGATWVLPFDADECWFSPHGRIADVLARLPVQVDVIVAHGFDHVGEGVSPWRRQDPQELPKVAFRARLDRTVHHGNHGCEPTGPAADVLAYRHFQYRSLEQMVRKVRQGTAAYAATGVPDTVGAHWRELDRLSDDGIAERWAALLAEDGLVYDPAPWRLEAQPSTSIVIPTWNRAGLLDQCLTAIGETAPAAEVVVVDNGSTDHTAEVIARHGAVPVLLEENEGFAKACNRGADAASGDRLVFLNNDTVPQPGWLDALGRHEGAIVGGHLVYPNGSTQHSGVFLRRDPQGRLEAFNRQRPAPAGQVPGVTGACLLIDRDLFDRLGRWDEGYWCGYEDVDLCLTAWSQGVPVRFEPDALVVHLEAQTDGRFAGVAQNVARLQDHWGHVEV